MSPLAAVGTLRNPIGGKNAAWFPSGDCRCHPWSSNHAGGANAVLCDGSVRFFSETLDHFVQYALATRAGSENVVTP
jgi:prepilin-type processing-associated H-X9-DG protein